MTEWEKLPFAYSKTNTNVRIEFSNGTWGSIQISESETVNLHMAATCLNYGQECFEGLKAYRGKDGNIRLFRWQENAQRINTSARRIGMPGIPESLFEEALITLIKHNSEFVPPYGTGASLYIRPLLLGTTGQLGLNASKDYLFIMYCSPVGPYFKNGFTPVKVVVERDTDRAAPLGTGNVKVGGNYAAAINTTVKTHELGYGSALYLDPREKKYVDECGPANFFGIKNNTYITPQSSSILDSITNKSLQDLARHLGMKVEKRPIELEELATFEEAAQCGTAAVITPICSVHDTHKNTVYSFGKNAEPGPWSIKLYETLVGIQYGDVEDPFGWISIVK